MKKEQLNLERAFQPLNNTTYTIRKAPARQIEKNREWVVPIVKKAKKKKDDEKASIVGGIVYAPDRVDTWGNFMRASEIEKMANRYMKLLQKGQAGVDLFHSNIPGAGEIIQSYIVKAGDPVYPGYEGAWAVDVEISDDTVIDRVDSGEINAFSMAGVSEIGETVETILEMDEDLANVMEWNCVDMSEVYEDTEKASISSDDLANGGLKLAGTGSLGPKKKKKYNVKCVELVNAYTHRVSFVEAGANMESPFPVRKDDQDNDSGLAEYNKSANKDEEDTMTPKLKGEVTELVREVTSQITQEVAKNLHVTANSTRLDAVEKQLQEVAKAMSDPAKKDVVTSVEINKTPEAKPDNTQQYVTKADLEEILQKHLKVDAPKQPEPQDGLTDLVKKQGEQINTLTDAVKSIAEGQKALVDVVKSVQDMAKDTQGALAAMFDDEQPADPATQPVNKTEEPVSTDPVVALQKQVQNLTEAISKMSSLPNGNKDTQQTQKSAAPTNPDEGGFGNIFGTVN